MASYFNGSSEIQAEAAASDGIQTLYLMNPNFFSSYSDTTQQQLSMLFFSPTTAPTNTISMANISYALPPNDRSSTLHGGVVPGFQYNIWPGHVDHNSVVVSVAGMSDNALAQDVISSLQPGFRRPVVLSPSRQGLSLGLSCQHVDASTPYRPISNGHEHEHEKQAIESAAIPFDDDIKVSGNYPSTVSAASNGVSGLQSVVLGSEYLRAAQELLDEVIDVEKEIKSSLIQGTKEKAKIDRESTIGDGSNVRTDGGGDDGQSTTKHGADFTAAQRQELQMKKAKLVNMLDQVEQRYRQYHHQMQSVISSFEQAAGFGAAKPYTTLALQTISKQFQCLKDSIVGQIRATSNNLGKEDYLLGAKVEGSRIKYIDNQLRQQQAVKQLRMIQQNFWRPQRGLPERAVTVLRAWLFEHFLDPYPKDADKRMLAKQTGLTRSQVSNWFINARVRLWKPMVEEMYMEKIKENEKKGIDEDNTRKNDNNEFWSNSSFPGESSTLHEISPNPTNQNAYVTEFSSSTIPMFTMEGTNQSHLGFTHIKSSEMVRLAQSGLKKHSSSVMQNSPSSILSVDKKPGKIIQKQINLETCDERPTNNDGSPLITSTINLGGGFEAYPMEDLDRFKPEQLTPRYTGNGVSLTLGLPQ